MSERIPYEETSEGILCNISDSSLLNEDERAHISILKGLENQKDELIKRKVQLETIIRNSNSAEDEKDLTKTIEERDTNEERLDTLIRQINILIEKEPLCIVLEREEKKRDVAFKEAYKNKEIARMEAIGQRCKEERQINQANRLILQKDKEIEVCKSIIRQKDNEIENCKRVIENMKKAPKGVTFAFDGMPVYFKPNLDKPYGDYTVWFSSKSHIYHIDRYCASYGSVKTHIFKVIGKSRPCKRCAENYFDFTEVPEWFENYKN